WRASIAGLVENMGLAMDFFAQEGQSAPNPDSSADPIAGFVLQEARKHRARGVSLGLFLGLMKYFRHAFLDVAEEAGVDLETQKLWQLFLNRYFDRLEQGLEPAWPQKLSALVPGGGKKGPQPGAITKDKYLTVFESLHSPAILFDSNNQIHNANQAFWELFDIPAISGKSKAAKPQKDKTAAILVEEVIGFAASRAGHYTTEKSLETKKGLRVFELCFRELKTSNRSSSETILLLHDITDRRAAETILGGLTGIVAEDETLAFDSEERRSIKTWLRQSEESLRFLVENLNVGIFLLADGPQWKIRQANTAFAKACGYASVNEILDKTLVELGLKQADWANLLKQVTKKGHGCTQKLKLKKADGTTMTGSWTLAPAHAQDKKPLWLVGSLEDITQSEKIVERIENAKKEWERTFDAVKDLIMILDKDYKVVRINRAMKNRFDMEYDQVIGKTCYELFHGTDEPPPDCPHTIALKTLETSSSELYAEKLQCWLDVAVSPLFDSRGGLMGTVHAARDVTEKKQEEQRRQATDMRIKQAQRMEALGTLVGGIAHDFNNILGAIMAYTELTVAINPDNTDVAQNLGHVLQASERARDLIRQILTFSRNESSQLAPIQMDLVVKESLKLLEASLPSTIEIVVNVGRNLSPILGELSQIHQVILNLCSNAFDAMRENGGALMVTLDEVELDSASPLCAGELAPGPHLRLAVQDTGHGMEEATIEHIFEPYFTTKGPERGTGLGLSVVHGIVKSHKGAIAVESELGAGSLFEVFFPVHKGPAPDEASRKTSWDLPHGSEHILFVDDEKFLRNAGKMLLETLGYAVTEAAGSSEALKLVKADPKKFSLVITDQTMPKMTGIKLAGKILEINQDIPIILCTGHDDSLKEDSIKRLGIYGPLIKPISIRQLAPVLRKILEKRAKKPAQ
ncbi:MAG: PAS domain-containing protein, partial [Desulfatibacillaceae bacterium]|nr:PAS domain-containing protein [Desulfatibacillaceae bacterium]